MKLKPENINAALELIEQCELVGAKVVVNPNRHQDTLRQQREEKSGIQMFSKYMREYLGQDIK